MPMVNIPKKPYAIYKRMGVGPRGGAIVVGYEVVERATNISMRRFPTRDKAVALRDELNGKKKG